MYALTGESTGQDLQGVGRVAGQGKTARKMEQACMAAYLALHAN